MGARALNVLLVSDQRPTLRHCTRLLTAFGYEVSAVASFAKAKEFLAARRIDVLVLSPSETLDEAIAVCAAADAAPGYGYTYKLVQVGEPQPAEILRAVEAGVDDFLTSPLEDGELLARLRMAARVVEYERRVGGSSSRDTSSGLLNPQSFLAHARAELRRLKPAESLACVVVELDRAAELRGLYGQAALARVAAQVVRQVAEHGGANIRLGRLDEDRIAVAIHGNSEQASSWTEQLRQRIAKSDVPIAERQSGVTVSCGVSSSTDSSCAAEDLLAEAEKSLRFAQQSGGDYVASFQQFVEEDSRWSELAAEGKVFENTIARNIMVPCTLILKATDSIGQVNTWLKQTQLRALPVVDDEGKLAGLVTASDVQALPSSSERQPVSTVMTKEVVTFDERTTLAALIDYFAQESPLLIVIANKGRPTGLVTPNSLATLIERLTSETFLAGADAVGTAGLIVPNLCGVDV